MAKIVPLKKLYYPVIVRVVLEGNVWYHTIVVEDTSEGAIRFSLKEIERLLEIEERNHWSRDGLTGWNNALAEINNKLAKFSRTSMYDSGFLVTVRPDNAIETLIVVDLDRKSTRLNSSH